MTDVKHSYVIVRTDLPPAVQAVQSVHAARACDRNYPIPENADHPHLVLLAVPNEEALRAAYEKLVRRQIPVVAYAEPDLGDSLTAVATPPLQGDSRKAFSNYPLLR